MQKGLIKLSVLGWFFGVMAGSAWAGEVLIGAGLGQPLFFRGYNVAVTYFSDNDWVFEYSHGWNLHLDDKTPFYESVFSEEERAAKLELFSEYSTGFGVGTKLTEATYWKLEFKEHAHELTHPGVADPDKRTIAFIERSVGPGVYYSLHLGDSGGVLEMGIRYWITVQTSLKGGQHEFTDAEGNTLIYQPPDAVFFPAVTLGYLF